MRGILAKFLEKRGIKSEEELDNDEKETLRLYESILSKKELTIQDIRHFLKMQVGLIEMKWRDHDKSSSQKAELIPYHTCYKALLDILDAPQAEREHLENHLNKIIEQ